MNNKLEKKNKQESREGENKTVCAHTNNVNTRNN